MAISPLGKTLSFEYDSLKHLDKVTVPGVYAREYDYKGLTSKRSSNLVETLSYTLGGSTTAGLYYDYVYDKAGNITTIKQNGSQIAGYKYDEQGQLLLETYGGTTYHYTYDTAGNILGVNPSGLPDSETYTYSTGAWKDLLTSIKIDGTTKSISYDASGNPKNWFNGNTLTNLEWSKGRQLTKLNKDSTVIEYAYDMSGIRSSKKVGSTTYNYITQNGQVIRQTWGSNILDIVYDNNGQPFALCYSNNNGASFTTFYYVLNAQGDVVRLVNSSGTTYASYEYDAWGKIVDQQSYNSNFPYLHIVNPIRYRGYYYDAETGWYYVSSRYYDPEIGRFISADFPEIVLAGFENFAQYNLFAYCFNNPVNLSDEAGTWPSWATKVLIGTAVIAAAAVLTVATAGTGTALACFAVGALKGAALGAVSGAASGALTGAVSHRIQTGSWAGAGTAALNGAADGYMSGAISGFVTGGLTSNACFVAGTVVATAAGYVAIETLKEGDLVWAWDEETGDVALKPVAQVFVNESSELIHLKVNSEEIITTPTHPFYVAQKGWFAAVNLRAGDILVLVNGEYVVVEQVQHEILEAPIKVYNFEVEDYHTYFVGEDGVLVHNSCGSIGGRGKLRANMLKNGPAPGPNYQAHHGLPWKNRAYFQKAGLNVNDVDYGRWVLSGGKGGHQSWSRRYGALWDNYIKRHPIPDAADIIDYFRKLNGL